MADNTEKEKKEDKNKPADVRSHDRLVETVQEAAKQLRQEREGAKKK